MDNAIANATNKGLVFTKSPASRETNCNQEAARKQATMAGVEHLSKQDAIYGLLLERSLGII